MTAPLRHDQETDPRCPWCLDGFTPAGLHPVLGAVYRMCPTRDWCHECGDTSVYPAAFRRIDDLTATLLADALAPIYCPNCLGVTAVIPLTNGGGIQ